MKNQKRLTSIFVFAIITVFFTGCASMSSMQTARVTDKGKFGVGFSGGYVKTEIEIGDLESIDVAGPLMEISARYGISEKLDVGAKLGIVGTSGADAKFQFLGNKQSKFASSAGFGVYYLSSESSTTINETTNTLKSTVIDLHFPLYFSVHPTNWLGIYAAPKYILRLNNYNDNGVSESASSSWLGVTSGLRLGRKNALFMEYSYFGSSAYSVPLGQFMIGIGIGIN
jgi:hypothetical protein